MQNCICEISNSMETDTTLLLVIVIVIPFICVIVGNLLIDWLSE